MLTHGKRAPGRSRRRAVAAALALSAAGIGTAAGALAQWREPVRSVGRDLERNEGRDARGRGSSREPWREPVRTLAVPVPDAMIEEIVASQPLAEAGSPSEALPWREAKERWRMPEPLDGFEWSPERPLEVGVRVPIERGVSVGALAEVSVPRPALDAFMGGGVGWNASATVDVDLDVPGGWRLSAGAGARSVPFASSGASELDAGDAEGVVWLRIGTTF